MAQFGGQKNPPWATQFAATAVSQPGHTGQSLDLNSLHCEYSKIRSNVITTLPGGAITLTFHIIPHTPPTALGVQQPSLLGASPAVYSQQSALAAASLSNQSAANYQLSQQTAALQQQAAAAAAAALQQVSHKRVMLTIVKHLCVFSLVTFDALCYCPPFVFFKCP